mmetsp:Transcript_20917/g.39208  ORF Transcript_20917/g.39208 Transcript_20917/m.39208 type:complete len:148 (-) Transcript_20917:252-695(-)|eukprot:CAMPEP_0197463692 /NCGR_PEP_ID=MMETSP1175-20131217/62510_1 /TAXON_ID=1003142 /ORGANISM="Triceratium dubium, Strain CCMP147" /LENGTH=147 /DNA_ID=CAMNT_0042999519 /DNA_START=68 /DNA_END=511 /DNA_ORIENTATION=+
MKFASLALLSIALFMMSGVSAGKYKLIQSDKDDDLCWGVDDVDEGEKLELKDCDKADEWRLKNGRIHPEDDDDLCVQARAEEGKRLRLEDCSSTSKQKWRYDKNGDDEWTPKKDKDLCVTYKGKAKKGAQLVLKDCDGDKDQAWEWD